MTLKNRIEVLVKLGDRLKSGDEYLDAVIHRTNYNNAWFSKENQHRRVKHIAEDFLSEEKLNSWMKNYEISDKPSGKSIAFLLSDNIPLEGIHDIICAFVAGHKSLIVLAENDQYLMPCILKFLKEIDEKTEKFFEITPKLEKFDGIITNIGNKKGDALRNYFGKYPNIFRKKRSSVAVITGEESDADLLKLGDDIFSYFGTSTRNISKMYFPKGYDLKRFLEITHEFKELVLNNKYKNNFDYNFAAFSLDKTSFHINGCMILVEKPEVISRTSVVHYEFYESKEKLQEDISAKAADIQNIVAPDGFLDLKTIPFGETTNHSLGEYLDEKDTMAFMLSV